MGSACYHTRTAFNNCPELYRDCRILNRYRAVLLNYTTIVINPITIIYRTEHDTHPHLKLLINECITQGHACIPLELVVFCNKVMQDFEY